MDKRVLDKVFLENNVDAVVSFAEQTRLWYAKVQTSQGVLIIEKNQATLFVDGRYIEYVKNHAKNVSVELYSEQKVEEFLLMKNFKNIAIESEYINLNDFKKLKKLLPSAILLSIKGQDLRTYKSAEEVEKISKAVSISLEAYEKLTPFLVAGVSELEISHKLNYLMKRLGADKEAFDSIIAFGKNSAMPHHQPTDNVLKKGDIVKIDFGAKFQGYCSDITRTFIFEKNEKTDPKLSEILLIVEEAAALGRAAVKPGVSASEIDAICRNHIKDKGYGNFFVTSTGHGVGIDIHELPRVSSKSNEVLQPGMVITVEPGIYIENLGGARIEDDLLVTETGNLVLSRKA